MSKLTLAVSFVLAINTGFAQFHQKWEARYNDVGFSDEKPKKIITDHSGNSYLLGNSDQDVVVIKFNEAGSELWNYQTGKGTPINAMEAKDIAMDQHGNIYVSAKLIRPYSSGPESATLFKLSAEGELLWHLSISDVSIPPHPNSFRLLVDTNNDVLAIVERENSKKISINKYSSNGVLLWEHNHSSEGRSYLLTDAILDTSNNLVITGYSFGFSEREKLPWLFVYDASGNTIMTGASAFSSVFATEYSYPVSITEKNSILYVAFSKNEIWKINKESGAVIQIITISGTSSVKARHINIGSDGFLYTADNNNDNLTFRKYNADGTLVWTNFYNPSIGSIAYSEDYEILNTSFDSVNNRFYALILREYVNLFSGASNNTYMIFESSADKQLRVVSQSISSKSNFIPVSQSLIPNENLIVAGSFDNGPHQRDFLLSHINLFSGAISDESFFSPVNSCLHRPEVVVVDKNGNSYVGGQLSATTGQSLSYFGIVKYDKDGKEVWRLKYAPNNSPDLGQSLQSIAVNQSDELIVTGEISEYYHYINNDYHQPNNLHTLKFNSDGNLIWERVFQLQIGESAMGKVVKLDDDGNVYVLAFIESPKSIRKLAIVAYSSTGTLLWSNIWDNNFRNYGNLAGTTSTPKPRISITDESILVGYSDTNYLDGRWGTVVRFRKFGKDGVVVFDKPLVIKPQYEDDLGFSSNQFLMGQEVLSNGNICAITKGWTYGNSRDHGLLTQPSHFYYMLTPHAEIIFEKSILGDFNEASYAGYAVDTIGQSFSLLLKQNEFVFQKRNELGDILWTKTKSIRFADGNNPAFVHVKKNGNPIFFSTGEVENNTNNFLLMERDANTGEELFVEEIDGGYDVTSQSYINNLTDQLMDVFRVPSTDDFVITGYIQDKHQWPDARTFLTLKYGTNGPNIAPVVEEEIPNQLSEAGSLFSFTFSATAFSDTQALLFTALLSNGDELPSWLNFNGTTRTFSGTPNVTGVYEIMVTATDTDDVSVSQIFNLTIVPSNSNPVLLRDIPDGILIVNQEFIFSLKGYFEDKEQTELIFQVTKQGTQSLPSWLGWSNELLELKGTPLRSDTGIYTLLIQVNDGFGGTLETTLNLTVIDLTTSLKEKMLDQIKIYPIPSKGTLNIDQPFQNTLLQIISLDGRVVSSHILNKNHEEVPLFELSPGDYLIYLSNKHNSLAFTFLIVKE